MVHAPLRRTINITKFNVNSNKCQVYFQFLIIIKKGATLLMCSFF